MSAECAFPWASLPPELRCIILEFAMFPNLESYEWCLEVTYDCPNCMQMNSRHSTVRNPLLVGNGEFTTNVRNLLRLRSHGWKLSVEVQGFRRAGWRHYHFEEWYKLTDNQNFSRIEKMVLLALKRQAYERQHVYFASVTFCVNSCSLLDKPFVVRKKTTVFKVSRNFKTAAMILCIFLDGPIVEGRDPVPASHYSMFCLVFNSSRLTIVLHGYNNYRIFPWSTKQLHYSPSFSMSE